jgi:hypothetical protein
MLGGAAAAQDLGMSFEEAAYMTCREVQAMPRETRISFALALVQRAAAQMGVAYEQSTPLDSKVGPLIRAGCTVYPDAFMLPVAAMSVRRAAGVEPRSAPATTAIPFETAAFLTCEQYGQMTEAQQNALEYDLAVHAGQHFGMRFEDTPSGRAKLDAGITPLVQGTCILAPDFHIYGVVARAVEAAKGGS